MRPIYVSFDRLPAPKGAAVHIEAFARALADRLEPIDLVTLGGDEIEPEPSVERWPGVTHHTLPSGRGHLILRAMRFRAQLGAFWERGGRRPVAHFRSILEGYPIAKARQKAADKIVFEVNGLLSIELKYHHPDVADDRELLRKLRAQEDRCLAEADLVVTPSAVTAEYLQSLSVDAPRIRVIPNGVDLDVFDYEAPRWRGVEEGRPMRMLYAGTMSAWQGVRQAIQALALYRRDHPAELVVVGPTRGRQRRQLDEWAREQGVEAHVEVQPPMTQPELAALHHQVDVVVAPLLSNDRNLVQGCCPLKVIEAMASGTPVVSSDLPVVRDLATDDAEVLLVKPGSAKAIKDAMLRLTEEPGLSLRLSKAARARVERELTWDRAGRDLARAYEEVLGIMEQRPQLAGGGREL